MSALYFHQAIWLLSMLKCGYSIFKYWQETTKFDTKVMESIIFLLEGIIIYLIRYSPQSNGQAPNVNKTRIGKFCQKEFLKYNMKQNLFYQYRWKQK